MRISRDRYARALRPDRRRPVPPGRHRPRLRGRARPRRARRGGRLRRRQDDPRRHGPELSATSAEGALDLVITNVVVIDPMLGIVKGDIGIKDGRIVGLGKAGNPDTQDGVDPQLVIGPGTEVIAGEHLIATPGGDRHATST